MVAGWRYCCGALNWTFTRGGQRDRATKKLLLPLVVLHTTYIQNTAVYFEGGIERSRSPGIGRLLLLSDTMPLIVEPLLVMHFGPAINRPTAIIRPD